MLTTKIKPVNYFLLLITMSGNDYYDYDFLRSYFLYITGLTVYLCKERIVKESLKY